ncbi:hypothetical protein Tco_0149410 [Tanacetum coccineum]
MQIPDGMITEEMKHTDHYKMYAEVFGLDVPLTQSQLTESTQGTHRTPSAPRSPTHKKDTAESSAPKRSTVISHKSRKQEAREMWNNGLNKHLALKRLKRMMNKIPGTRKDFCSGSHSIFSAVSSPRSNDRFSTPLLLTCTLRSSILHERILSKLKFTSQIQKAIDNQIPSQVDASVQSYMSGHILHVHPAQTQTLSVPEQQYQLYLSMKDNLQLQQQDIAIWLALQMKFKNLQVQQTTCRPSAVRPRDQDDPHDDAHPEGENSAKRHKTSEYEAYVSGESSSGQVNKEERGPSTSASRKQDIMEEVSLTIDEAKLKKMADEMLRQRCTSGDEHQYHIDQMKNFLKSDIVWESRKEILVSPHPRKTTPLVQSCQRDPEAPALSLINQDLLYLKKGSSGPEKIVLSLHKFPAIIFNDDDIEERTSRWVNKALITRIYNKNDIVLRICHLLIMNGKVPDYAETGLLWSLITYYQKFSELMERVHAFQLGINKFHRN